MPLISEFSAAGEMKIDFDPPKALVPEKWDLLFDHEKQLNMTTEYKSAMKTLSDEAF